MFVWWPRLDSDVEDRVKSCSDCQGNGPSPPTAPFQPWKWPTRPWARVHLDYASPFLGRMFLIAIDAHSKWMEVDTMSSTTSVATIQSLRNMFARFGLPEQVVTDNGRNFVSEEFKEFLQKNRIKHTTSAPYHPSTNGLAERAVQTFKQGLTKLKEGTINERISRFLFNYRITPQSTKGTSPAELLLGRRPLSCLDLLKPDLSTRIETKQAKQRLTSNSRTVPNYELGDAVYARNFGYGSRWIPGLLVENTGPLSFKMECEGGRIWCRHVDHIRRCLDVVPDIEPIIDRDLQVEPPVPTESSTSTETQNPTVQNPTVLEAEPLTSTEAHSSTGPVESSISTSHRYPSRDRKPPDRYTYTS